MESLFDRQKLSELVTVVEKQKLSGMETLSKRRTLSKKITLSETCASFDTEEGSKKQKPIRAEGKRK